METYLRVCPCVLLSELNDRGITASCEIDMCSAITMRALSLATQGPAACLDWNNNYGDDPDKVIFVPLWLYCTEADAAKRYGYRPQNV